MFLPIKSIMAERIEPWKLRNPAIQLCSVGIYAWGRAWLKRCLLTRCHAWLGAIHSVRDHTASGFLSWRRKIPYFLMFLLSALATCRIHFHRTIGFELCWRAAAATRTAAPRHSHTHTHTHTHTRTRAHTHTHTHTHHMYVFSQRNIKEIFHVRFSFTYTET